MLEVVGLTKRYNSLAPVDDVSFRINQGELCGYLGLNASGKSTTLVPHASLFMNARFCFPRSSVAHA